jgi:hypothetical protein
MNILSIKLMYTLSAVMVWVMLNTGCKAVSIVHEKQENKVVFSLVDSMEHLGLKTGDLLLFQSLTRDGIFTQIGTLSPFTHCALVISNPDRSLWLLHATDNNFAGESIPVLFEDAPRNGVILTRLEDSFISVDYCKTGFYKHIRILRFDELWAPRPDREVLLDLYEQNKKYPFTTSKIPFILSAFDLTLFDYDLISMPDDKSFFCSEFVHHVLREAGVPITHNQQGNEYTPRDISNLEPYIKSTPLIYKFKDGRYRPEK